MTKNILFRAVIEVLGKPKEHIEQSLQNYLEQLKQNERYEVVQAEVVEAKKQAEQDLWATFAEVELKAEKVEDLIGFCFDYMPSVLEVIRPKQLNLQNEHISSFLNDLQARLHQVDMVAKQVKMENDILKKSMGGLLKNYITILLGKGDMNAEQLSRLTGINKDKLEDFLDQLIDEGRIDLKEGIYYLKKEALKGESQKQS